MYVIKTRHRRRPQAPLWLSIAVVAVVAVGVMTLAYIAFTSAGSQEHSGLPLRQGTDAEQTSTQESTSEAAGDGGKDTSWTTPPRAQKPEVFEPRIPGPWVTTPIRGGSSDVEAEEPEPESRENEDDGQDAQTLDDTPGGQTS